MAPLQAYTVSHSGAQVFRGIAAYDTTAGIANTNILYLGLALRVPPCQVGSESSFELTKVGLPQRTLGFAEAKGLSVRGAPG
jgi:hypothetical protein